MFITIAIEHQGKSSSLSSLSPLSKAAQKMPTFGNACMRSRSAQGIACGKVVQNFYELTLDLGKDPSSRGPAQVRPSRLSSTRGSQAIRSQGSDALVPLQSIIAEAFFAMSATCMRSPIDLQAVNGCQRPGGKTYPVIIDAVACASDTTYFETLVRLLSRCRKLHFYGLNTCDGIT